MARVGLDAFEGRLAVFETNPIVLVPDEPLAFPAADGAADAFAVFVAWFHALAVNANGEIDTDVGDMAEFGGGIEAVVMGVFICSVIGFDGGDAAEVGDADGARRSTVGRGWERVIRVG